MYNCNMTKNNYRKDLNNIYTIVGAASFLVAMLFVIPVIFLDKTNAPYSLKNLLIATTITLIVSFFVVGMVGIVKYIKKEKLPVYKTIVRMGWKSEKEEFKHSPMKLNILMLVSSVIYILVFSSVFVYIGATHDIQNPLQVYIWLLFLIHPLSAAIYSLQWILKNRNQ